MSLYKQVMTVGEREMSEVPLNRHQESIWSVHAKPQPEWLRLGFGRTLAWPNRPKNWPVAPSQPTLSISSRVGPFSDVKMEFYSPTHVWMKFSFTLVWISSQLWRFSTCIQIYTNTRGKCLI
jgi:hypothetical protein